ncbi:MAG: AMP-binding protein [Microcoleaceae cyanobacterium]
MKNSYTSNSMYQSARSLPEIWPTLVHKAGETIALHDPHATPVTLLTYRDLWIQIQQFAAGLQSLGIEPTTDPIPPRIALFADDSPRWLIADQGIMTAGAADVVRGGAADPIELGFILKNSGSTGLIVENFGLLKKLRAIIEDLPIKFIVLLSDEEPQLEQTPTIPVVNFSQLLNLGEDTTLRNPFNVQPDTLATLLYTSGTTGKPKGVMLTHGNLLHQIRAITEIIQPDIGDCFLSILPTWHSFGRVGQYYVLSRGCKIVYTNIRYFKQDLKEFKPLYMTSVPRLWESIYEAAQKQFREQSPTRQKLIQFFFKTSEQYILARRQLNQLTLDASRSQMQKLLTQLQTSLLAPLHKLGNKLVYQKVRQATGGELKAAISGGGSLGMHLENFFEIVGVELLVGYGLTETAPVLTARRFNYNLRGSAGKPIAETELQIVDPETRQPLPTRHKGLVMARGPQVMKGYFENPTATAQVLDRQGWFNTGDLGWLTADNDLVLTGRAKDTIVLTNGENIEPQPIEDACARSPYIDQILLVGQDQKALGALIVPNLDALKQWANTQQPLAKASLIDYKSKPVQDLFRQELNREVKNRPSYRPDDRIVSFRLILEPFSTENGMMTQTLKIKRSVVQEQYQDLIDQMYAL